MTLDLTLPADLESVVAQAIREDLGSGDLTASLIDPSAHAQAHVVVREQAILCGMAWFDEVFRQIEPATSIEWLCAEGQTIDENQIVCIIRGPAISLLSAERTALNFLQSLSGTATTTRQYVDVAAAYGVRILDTRKTIPGLRTAQKYAVKVGGGTNHRFGLFDGVLVKENHQYTDTSVRSMMNALKSRQTGAILIEVEIENIDELEAAIASGANRVMLDNFTVEDMVVAVRQTNQRVELEASGNIDLDNLACIARTGVDYVSIGGLTKNLRAIDFSMRFERNAENQA